MTSKALSEPGSGKRWFAACLIALTVIVAYNESMNPVVKALGFAHARVLHHDSGPVLVVDHLPSADAPVVQAVFEGEIWGRHAFRVGEFLGPFLLLLIAMFGVCRLVTHHASFPGARFFHLHRGCFPPPISLWASFFLGGCLAACSVEYPGLPSFSAVFPFLLALLATAVLVILPTPSAAAMGGTLAALTAGRWFWLGYLTLVPTGLFRYDWLSESSDPLTITGRSLLWCIVGLGVLHWATRPITKMDLTRFSGDIRGLALRVERLNLFAIQELFLLCPLVLMAAAVSSLRIEQLLPYLVSLVLSALMTRWSVEGKAQPPEQEVMNSKQDDVPQWRLTWANGLLGLAALALSALILHGGVPRTAKTQTVIELESKLSENFGHQARLLQSNGQTLLIGCDLDVGKLSLASEVVRAHLPESEADVVSVRTRRWERVGRLVLALTITVFLVLPTYLLTVATPGSSSGNYMTFCGLLGGVNGAFAIGSSLGWFWLDPAPHWAAFFLCVGLGWLGFGHARDWIDRRVDHRRLPR